MNVTVRLVPEDVTKDHTGSSKRVPDYAHARRVYAKELSVGMQEVYSAALINRKPTIKLEVHRDEYQGEALMEYEKRLYRILRTYARDEGRIELTGEAFDQGVV